jgi:hypothetical protein
MIKVNTKKSGEIAEKLRLKHNERISIYKGTPDARFKEQYWAICKTWEGMAATGTYGVVVAKANTLEGLLQSEEYFNI